jgi:hypothetical protein
MDNTSRRDGHQATIERMSHFAFGTYRKLAKCKRGVNFEGVEN